MNTAIVGLGSNIEPEKNIQKAKEILSKKYTVLKESRFITTKPIGIPRQANFINGALLITTKLNLKQLRKSLKEIEHALGRERDGNKFGPRTIDLDLLVWNGEIMHEDVNSRDFVKTSVLELISKSDLMKREDGDI